MAPPLYVLLCSGEHEKIQMAAMTASVGAVSERRVEVFVSMNAILAFKRAGTSAERLTGGVMSRALTDKGAPDPVQLLSQAKDLGELRVHACSMALDVLGLELDELQEGVFDGALGLTRFLSDAEAGQLLSF